MDKRTLYFLYLFHICKNFFSNFYFLFSAFLSSIYVIHLFFYDYAFEVCEPCFIQKSLCLQNIKIKMKKPNDIITATWLQFQQNKDNSTNQNLLLQSQFPKHQHPRLEEMLGTILDSVRLVGQKWRGSPKKTVMLSSLNPGFLALPFLSLLVFPTLLVRNPSYIYP
jgi:hypothetical protein